MKRLLLLTALLCVLAAPLAAQVPVALSPVDRQQFFSQSGAPLASGCIFTYITGTSTPLATYTDGTGTAQNTNPIILDAGGFANLWLSNSSYRFSLYSTGGVNCASGVFQRTVDNVSAYTIINTPQNLFLLGASSDPGGSAGELAYRTDIPCFRGFTTLWDCFVTLTGIQSLTNKTFVSPAFTGTETGMNITSPTITTAVINGASTGTGIQGTDTKLLTAGSVGAAGNFFCSDANGGASTNGCPTLQGIRSTSAYTNATTTFSDVTGIIFTALASTNYKLSCDIMFQGSATTAGPKFQFTGPAAATIVSVLVDGANVSTGVDNFVNLFSTANTAMGTLAAGGRNFIARVTLILQNGVNAGNVQLQAAANGAGTLTIFLGSACSLQNTN